MEAVYKFIDLTVDETRRPIQLFTKMDKNADGYVDQQEFVEACLNNQKLMERLRHHSQD